MLYLLHQTLCKCQNLTSIHPGRLKQFLSDGTPKFLHVISDLVPANFKNHLSNKGIPITLKSCEPMPTMTSPGAVLLPFMSFSFQLHQQQIQPCHIPVRIKSGISAVSPPIRLQPAIYNLSETLSLIAQFFQAQPYLLPDNPGKQGFCTMTNNIIDRICHQIIPTVSCLSMRKAILALFRHHLFQPPKPDPCILQGQNPPKLPISVTTSG